MTDGITLSETGKSIILNVGFASRHKCKKLPGRRWHPAEYVWTVPATPALAARVVADFEGEIIEPAIQELAKRHGHADRLRDLGEAVEYIETKTVSWTHQRRGTQLILHQDATYLAYDMGTGKSKCVVDATCFLGCKLILIIAPASVVSVWPGEFERHGVKSCMVVPLDAGGVPRRVEKAQTAIRLAAARDLSCVIVVNYEAIWRPVMAKFIEGTAWDMMVCDEAQRIKAPGGKTSRFLAAVRGTAARRVALSGTPMPHSPLDIYAQLRWLDPGIFGNSFTAFRARYARMGGYGNHQVIGYQHLDELHEKFYSIADRVKKADVLDLPPFTHVERHIALATDTMRAYKQLEREFVADVEGGVVTASNALARLLRLQQMASGYAVTEDGQQVQMGEEKARELENLLADDLSIDEPVVVFCRFVHDLEATQRAAAAAGRKCYELSGRRKELAAWQSATGGDVIAVQIQAGGLGVNLVRAAYCVFFSLTFSLGDFDQALARCHRSGQERNVTYIHLIASGTVDAKIYKALEQRAEVVESVLKKYRNNVDDSVGDMVI